MALGAIQVLLNAMEGGVFGSGYFRVGACNIS